MDPADNGFVAAGVLLGCALHPAAGVRDLLRAALDRGCVEFAGADRHARDDGSDYADGEEGEKAKEDAVELSSSSWASNLIVSLQLLVDIRETADLTWGEVYHACPAVITIFNELCARVSAFSVLGRPLAQSS
jgi:hypothetical protein